MPTIVFDLIIIAVLALFAWRGGVKGLVLTLCGLAAIFVAYFGAQFLSNVFCGPVAGIIKPVIAQTIHEALPESIQEALDKWNEYLPNATVPPAATAAPEGSDVPQATDPADGEGSGEAEPQIPVYTVEQVMDDIKEAGLFKALYNTLKEAVDSGEVRQAAAQSPVDALADYIARGISKSVLFGLIYLAVVVGWFLFTRALDLAFKLPVLAQINFAGGLIIGLAEGALLLVVAVWLGRLLGLIPPEADSPLLRLFTVDTLWNLWKDLPR